MSPAELDQSLLLFARTRGHPRWAERAVYAYSRSGEHAACWLGLGLVGALTTRDRAARATWLRGMRVVAASYAAN